MRDGVRAFLIAACFLLLASPAAYGSTGFAFFTTTIQVVAAVMILVATWDHLADRPRSSSSANAPAERWSAPPSRRRRFGVPRRSSTASEASEGGTASAERSQSRIAEIAVIVAAALLVFVAARGWVHEIAIHPGTGRVFQTDFRLVALPGLLLVPVACALCAAALASDGFLTSAAAWIALLGVLAVNEPLRRFASTAQIPVYWPLVALAAWTVARGWWLRAAIVSGALLVVGPGWISVAPIVLMAAWRTSRKDFISAAIVVVVAATVPLIWGGADAHALQLPMGEHDARGTIGLTGLLLRAGWPSAILPVHVLAMLGVYVAAWLSLGRRKSPLPWMGLALLAITATTPQPAGDAYFDVFVFFVFAALAETRWLEGRHTFRVWVAALVASAVVASAVVWRAIPLDTDIDVGSYADRPLLLSGFADNEEAGRSFAWVEGAGAEVIVPRRSRRAADLDIVCEPHLPTREFSQQMSVALNGTVLGTVTLGEGWQTVTLPAPSSAWQIGVNDLRLSFTTAISPLEAGVGTDPRKLSVAFDRITVRTK